MRIKAIPQLFNNVFYGWWLVLVCSFLGFYIAGTVFYSFTAFVKPLVAEFNWSYTQISVAASLRGLEMGIFAPLVGIFVDRVGYKIIVLVGTIIVGAGMLLFSMTNSLISFYAASLLIGLGAGGCTVVVIMTAVANWFNRKAGLALGLVASGFGAGGLLVPGIVWMIDNYHWRTTLLIIGLITWGLCVPLSFFMRGKPENYGYLPDGDDPPNPSLIPVEQEPDVRIHQNTDGIPFKTVMRDKDFWYLNLAEAIRMMVAVSILTHVMPYLQSIGIPRSTAGLIVGALALFSIAGRAGFGYLSDIFDRRYVMAASYALMILGLVVFSSFIKGPWSLLIFLILFSPGFGGGMTMRASLIKAYFGTVSYGKILGIAMGVGSIAAIIGPTLAGWTFDTFGSYRPIWLAYIGLNIVGMFLLLGIKPLKTAQQRYAKVLSVPIKPFAK